MENSYDAISVKSILLLKERIIKVETLLEKYASLAKKFNDLEKSNSQLVENERTAKKDAAKYLEKYCKLTKKCSALLSKIKSLEETIKEKNNLVEQHQNEVTKLDSVINIYKLERKNFNSLKAEKDFLLSLAWKLFKDSGLESKENKNRKSAEIFFTKFENDLRALRLYDFRNQKLKVLKSQAEDSETASLSLELPVASSVESDFIDIDVASDSTKSTSFEEVGNDGGRIEEYDLKPNEDYNIRGHVNITASSSETFNNYLSHPLGNDDLYEPRNSEKCVDVNAKELCFDVHRSVNNILSNFGASRVEGNGFNVNSEPIREEQLVATDTSKQIGIEKYQVCDKISTSEDGPRVRDSENEKKSLDCRKLDSTLALSENPTVLIDRYISCKQCKRKSETKCTHETDGDTSTTIETERVNDSMENGNEIKNQDLECTKKDFRSPLNLCGEDSIYSIENRKNNADRSLQDTASLSSVENDESRRIHEERTNEGTFELQKMCQFPTQKSDESENISTEKSDETYQLFKADKKMEKVSEKKIGLEICEIGDKHTLSPNSISNMKKSPTADLKTLQKSPSGESIKEISDEEVFGILQNFKTVRLVSPLKDTLPKKSSKHGDLIVKSYGKTKPKRCLVKNNMLNASITEAEFKIGEDRVQISNNNALPSGNSSSEQSTLTEESTQTDDMVNSKDREENQNSSEQIAKPDKAITVPVTKYLVRKVFRKIWNGKLKKKLKHLNELLKNFKTHPCCFMFSKAALHYLGGRSNEKQFVSDFFRNSCVKSRYKNKMRAVKKRLSSWHVEDAIDTVPGKSQYLFGEVNFKPEIPIYNNAIKRLNNSHMAPERDRLMPAQQFDWFTGSAGKSDCAVQRDVFGNTFRTFLPDSILRDVTLSNFKKESENFRSLPVDNYNCSDPFFGGYYNMLDIKDLHDIPKPFIDCDRVVPPESGTEEKLGSQNTSMESCDSEEKSVEVPKCKVVPRRSPRIQGRSSRLGVVDVSPKCASDSLRSPVLQIEECESVLSGSNTSGCVSATGCIQSENSIVEPRIEPSKCLEKKYKELFGETANSEYAENNSESETHPSNVNSTISYNLRHNTGNKIPGNDDNPSSGRKRMASRLRQSRLSKKAMNALESDYFSSEKEDKECELSNVSREPSKPLDSSNLLDSIMVAMSKQTEEFKPKVAINKPVTPQFPVAVPDSVSTPHQCSFPFPGQQEVCSSPRNYYDTYGEGEESNGFPEIWKFQKESPKESDNCVEAASFPSRKCNEGSKIKKLVESEIRKFLKAEITSVEDGEEKLKPCIAVLEKASEDIVVSVIVAEVMANVDEELQVFDRPAPPLTQTQHRLMIILTMLTNSCEGMRKINYKILNAIWTKLFPENFFWPDDSVEMASRFYSALCKKINYFKGIWRFCFKAVSSMRQRWCIPIFVVFQVWPDILHNANEIQDNILVNTFVNVILHTPKSEALRRKRQEEKLLAIKHLLINFYNFQVNVTIEQMTQQLFASLWGNTPGSIDALIFVSRCRHWTWIKKNIIPPLIETLTRWSNGMVTDECGFKTLDIIQQISSVLPVEDNPTPLSVKDIISGLYKLLASSGSDPIKEQKIVSTLCSLGHHTGVRDVLCALSSKFPSEDPIQNEIKKAINSSCRRRKQFIKNSKNMIKMEEKFKKKKQEMKKKKKVKKKKKKAVAVEKSSLEILPA